MVHLTTFVLTTLAATSSFVAGARNRVDLGGEADLEKRATVVQPITTCKRKGTFALTFDDGPYTYGHNLNKMIHGHGGNATYFVNGYNYGCIYDYADELIARYKSGALIASHTWNHLDITTISASKLRQQITLVETALGKILGIKPRYFRPPYGSYNDASLKVVESMGYQVFVTWDVDSGDSAGASASQELSLFKKLAASYPKAHMPLNHETYSSTSQSMPQAVPLLVQAGYKLVTVADCLGDSQPYQAVFTPGKRDKTWTCAGTPAPNAN